MELIKTRGIILKTMDYREKDRLVYVFSEDLGKITLISKGARGKATRFMSAVMPLNVCSFVLLKGRNIHTLSEIEVINTFPRIKNDFDDLAYGMYFAELCDIAMDQDEVNGKYFLDLIKGMYLLESGSLERKMLARAMELKTLIRTGNIPDPQIHGSKMTRQARDIVYFMMNRDLGELASLEYEDRYLDEVETLTRSMISENFPRRPRSLDILDADY